jgi:hypothetical protein
MTIRYKDFKCKNAISASRLSTLEECSSKYGYKYLYKGPDTTNDGAMRGSTCHDTFEILANKRHFKIVEAAIQDNSCANIPSLWKLVTKYAKKYNVADETNLSIIDEFIVTGLKTEFYGPDGTFKIEMEKRFDIEIEKPNILYKLTGFIDRLNWIKNGDSIYIDIQDYKSSKGKFDKDKIEVNHQSNIYQLAIKYLYPDIKLNSFKFIFLKFRKDPYQQAKLMDDTDLLGYEYWLTEIQKTIENFTEKNLADNFAALTPQLKMTRCGKIGIKKDGTPNFLCSAYKPLQYHVILDKNGVVKKSSFNDDLIPGEGETKDEKYWSGCSYFYNSQGKPRNFG